MDGILSSSRSFGSGLLNTLDFCALEYFSTGNVSSRVKNKGKGLDMRIAPSCFLDDALGRVRNNRDAGSKLLGLFALAYLKHRGRPKHQSVLLTILWKTSLNMRWKSAYAGTQYCLKS